MDKDKKTEINQVIRTKEGDTGSTEVQVALITERINAAYHAHGGQPQRLSHPAGPAQTRRAEAEAFGVS